MCSCFVHHKLNRVDIPILQVSVLTRIYPCSECASHFKEIVQCVHQPIVMPTPTTPTPTDGGSPLHSHRLADQRCLSTLTLSLLLCRQNAPRAGSQQALQQWMCEVHNSVNRSLGKPEFNCRAVGLRWPSVDCNAAEACALPGVNGR
jgi:Erv1 / Alr family